LASTKTNVAASFAGQIWTAVLGIVFVPVYLRYIGVESYGLIGIFMSLQAFMSLLDFGISPTINREMARLSISPENGQEMHDLRRTLLIPNWLSAIAILIILCALSPIIANYWVTPKSLSVATVTRAFLLISFSTAFQFLSGFNAGGLIGLQKQVLINGINICFGTVRYVGGWVVLVLVSPTIEALLGWQFFVVVLQTIATSIAFKRSLFPAPAKGRFRKDLLLRVWRFATGMTGMGVIALVLMQSDKIILSRMLNLEDFGYYSLAVTLSSLAISMIVTPIVSVVYPKLSTLVALGNDANLIRYYHRACQLLAGLLIPTVTVLAFFSYQVILLWTRNSEIAEHSHVLLTLVVIGGGMNALLMLPYHMQLAHGWTKLAIYLGLAAICTVTPLMIVGVHYYGVFGGVLAWIVYNAVYGAVMIMLMHRRILVQEKWHWLVRDVLPPTVVSVVFNIIVYKVLEGSLSSLTMVSQIVVIGLVSVTTLAIGCVSLGSLRELVKNSVLGYE